LLERRARVVAYEMKLVGGAGIVAVSVPVLWLVGRFCSKQSSKRVFLVCIYNDI
jgi:hypothetical protein